MTLPLPLVRCIDMEATVLPFNPKQTECSCCGKSMIKRDPSKDSSVQSYCSYGCGSNGQPQYTKAAMLNTRGLNE